jgi:hypothetical protein
MPADSPTASAMPEPWFVASNSYNRPLLTWLGQEPLRPLRDGERRLRGFILPPFQRPAVWVPEQTARLIESIYAGVPVGAYVLNMPVRKPYDFDGWLLDGQQRWTAISEYVDGEFEVHGWRFPDLPASDRNWFLYRPLAELETKFTDYATCLEVYERLAYGGTPHGPVPAAPGP